MNKTTSITLATIAILAAALPAAYADSHPHWVPDAQFKWKSAWCDGFKGVNGTNGVMDCYGHYQKMLKFNLKENFAIQTEDPPSAKELKDELTKKINELKIIKKAPEPTEAEKLGISEETLKQLKEKAQEQRPQDFVEDLKECFGGQNQAYAFQSEYAIADLLDKLEQIEKENLTTREWKLIAECQAILYLRDYAGSAYPLMVVREDTTPKSEPGFGNAIALERTKAVKPDADRFATPEKMKKSEDAANAYIDSQSYLKHLRIQNWKDLDRIQSTDVRTAQEQRSDIATLEHQRINAEEAGWKARCESAWQNSAASGDRAKRNWAHMLLDGTCDDYIPDLVEKRGDYKLKMFKGLTKEKCPDCKSFE